MQDHQIDIRDLELNALLEITQAINNNLSEDDLYRIYRFTLMADLKVSRLAMFVVDQEWGCKVNYGTERDLSDSILPVEYQSLSEPKSIAPDSYEGFEEAFPVRHKDKLLAVVFVGSGSAAINSTFLQALSNILIVALENKKLARKQLAQEAYRKELEIAKKVQNFLFPKTLPNSTRLKIEASYLPHQDVGGDYYDYIALSEDKFMICIADVSGKGVPAALLMSNFQASLRALIRNTHDLDEIIHDLNHATYINSNGENFITFFIGIYDFGSQELQYANCGHNPLILFTKNGMITLEEGTTVIGMFDPLPFLSTQMINDLGSFSFFGYTDGLTETFNPEDEQFGLERLIEVLKSCDFENLPDLHQKILTALDDFREGKSFDDDITMISCQVSS